MRMDRYWTEVDILGFRGFYDAAHDDLSLNSRSALNSAGFRWRFISETSQCRGGEEVHRACSDGDKKARDILIERNLRLVAHVIKILYRPREQEDLISIGTIGLIKAVNTFDKDKNIRLATYAEGALKMRSLCILEARKVFR